MYVFTLEYIANHVNTLTGATLCQTFNLTAEDLQYKWEAMNYRSTATHSEISPLTKDSIAALKAKIQRSLSENIKKPQLRAIPGSDTAKVDRTRLPPNLSKNINSGQKFGAVQVKVEQSTGAPGPSPTHAVTFRGPAMHSPFTKQSSCECFK